MSRVVPLYQTDDAIIAGIRNFDEKAVDILYRKHREYCLRNMLFLYPDEETNKDIYQDAVIVFIEKVRTGNLQLVNASIQTYLYKICQNQILVRFKTAKKVQLTGEDMKDNEIVTYTDWLNEMNGINSERINAIKEELQVLKEKGPACFELLKKFFFETKTMSEIVSLLHYTDADSAKAQKWKCQERLKKQVLKRLGHA